MRERTYKVHISKLATLTSLHRSSKVAAKLNITMQRWGNYVAGRNDMPESVIDRLCEEYGFNKTDIVIE